MEVALAVEQCEFKFIADAEIRASLQRYYEVSLSTFNAACYPWTVLLAGRAIMTILLDVLNGDRTGVLLISSSCLMTNRTLFANGGSGLSKFDSIDLVSAAVDRGLVPGHATRLFDPGLEGGSRLSRTLSVEEWKEVAEIAIEVLVSLDRKLSDANRGRV